MSHRISWSGEDASFHCDAAEAAPCRSFPTCEHESWPCEHPAVAGQPCWKLPWLENVPPGETYDGDPAAADEPADRDGIPIRDSAIETTWEGDYLLWSYK